MRVSGSYCRGSTEIVPILAPDPCPDGTYGELDGLTHEENCTICGAGVYCIGLGQVNHTGPIAAGHFARYGSTVAEPFNDDTDILGICTKGHYCPEGSENPLPCPFGTYQYVNLSLK